MLWSGTNGDDIIYGSAFGGGDGQPDVMAGGLGNDSYLVDRADDVVVEHAGEGTDEVNATIEYTLAANVEHLRLGGSVYRGSGNELDNWIKGNDSANLLYGLAGDDWLVGNGGADILVGGPGDDRYSVEEAGDTVVELADEGYDMIQTGASYTLPDFVEALYGRDFSGGQALTGNALDNRITGSDGNDVIDGGAGRDWMSGGWGDDIYIVDDPQDQVYESNWNNRGGTDEVRTAIAAYTLPAEVENLTGTSDSGQVLTGNMLSNLLKGGAGDDFLYGGDGEDWLHGGDGDDYLDGQTNADHMAGGAGNDVYEVDSIWEEVVELDGEGEDEVRTAAGEKGDPSLFYVMPAFVENLVGTSTVGQAVRGNALGNRISMGEGDDLLVLDDGGDDRVSGGDGHDFFYYGAAFGNGDSTDGGAGVDTVGLLGSYGLTFDADDLLGIERLMLFSRADWMGAPAMVYQFTSVNANVAAGGRLEILAAGLRYNESLRFDGSAETDGHFTILAGAGEDRLTGGAKGDHISGGAHSDLLEGGGGNDTLIGGAGGDTLRGGTGRDTFRFEEGDSFYGECDFIHDFTVGDRIDLRAIDADTTKAGDQAFVFIGNAAFSNVAGQLRVSAEGFPWQLRIEGDTNGDGVADFLLIAGRPDMTLFTASDFLL
jgi:Ca2+-binding RTX toxin-like protein